MFKFFSKKVQPYTVSINSGVECKESILNILKVSFFELYNQQLFLHRVSKVIFHICDNNEFSGKVYNEDLSYNQVKILISIRGFKDGTDLDKVKIQIKEILNHEVTHVKHKFFSDEFNRINKYSNRKIGKNILNLGLSAIDLKFKLDNLLSNCYIEGFARYYEKEWKYTVEQLVKIHDYNLNQVLYFKEILLKGINEKSKINKDEEKFMNNLAYELGLNMIYSILIANEKMTQKELFDLSFVKMFKLYEKSIKKINDKFNINLKILFSYNSGNGIVDYSSFCKLIFDMKNIK